MSDTDTRTQGTGEAGRDSGPTSTTDRHQPSALGGEVATRSGTAPTEEDEAEGSDSRG